MKRNIGVCILLSIVTCGLYSFYWLVVLNDELNELSGEDGASGVLVLVFSFLTCGIYSLYWYYKAGEKIRIAQFKRNMAQSDSLGIMFLILGVLGLGIISFSLMQDSINKMVE